MAQQEATLVLINQECDGACKDTKDNRRKALLWSLEAIDSLPSNSAFAKHRRVCILKALELLDTRSAYC